MFSKGMALPPRSLTALISAITVVPLVTLLWLGLATPGTGPCTRRPADSAARRAGADLVVAALQRAIAGSEQQLASGNQQWPDDAVVVTFRDGAVEVSPNHRVAYLPFVSPLREASAATFARGEDLEFRQRNLKAAVNAFVTWRSLRILRSVPALYSGSGEIFKSLESGANPSQPTLDSPRWLTSPPGACRRHWSPCTRAANYWKGTEPLGGTSSRSVGTRSRPSLWPLGSDRAGLLDYAGDAANWSETSSPPPRQAEIFADAVGTLWDQWKSTRSGGRPSSGRESLDAYGQTVTVVWQASDGIFRALLAAPAFVKSEWLAAIAPAVKEQRIAFSLRDVAGQRTFGAVDASGAHKATRSAAESALPWNVVTASLDPPDEEREFTLRRRLLIAGLVLLVGMALMASYLIFRAISRELAAARLQSDFVAAVSHEFRTPLTSLRQFTDMLREHRDLSDERRGLLRGSVAATDRLTRLVEALLDFGRMEGGARI